MKTHENPEGIKLEIQSLNNAAGDLIYLLTVKIKYKGMNNFTTVITEEFSYFGDASDRMSIEMDKWRNYQQQKNPIQWKQEFLGDFISKDNKQIAEKINEEIKQFFHSGVYETEVTESGIPGVVNYRTHQGTKLAVPIQIADDKIKDCNWRLVCNGQARVTGTEVKILTHNFHTSRK